MASTYGLENKGIYYVRSWVLQLFEQGWSVEDVVVRQEEAAELIDRRRDEFGVPAGMTRKQVELLLFVGLPGPPVT